MSEAWLIFCMLTVIFIATVIRSALGFGEALIAVPLLALLMPVEVAVPLAVLVSITVALVVLIEDWRKVHFRSAWWLVLSTLFGIPVGIQLLTAVSEAIVKAVLAIIIMAFSTYCLLRRTPLELRNDRLAWVFGFGAGVLGGAYGTNGPPLVVYGTLRRWSAEQFRATLQSYFLPASIVQMAGYWYKGLWVPAVTRYYLLSLPLAAVSIVLGRAVNRRLASGRFLRWVHVALILIGLALLIQSLWSVMSREQKALGSVQMNVCPSNRLDASSPGCATWLANSLFRRNCFSAECLRGKKSTTSPLRQCARAHSPTCYRILSHVQFAQPTSKKERTTWTR
jgi:uncharacterized membrane protein YfcA